MADAQLGIIVTPEFRSAHTHVFEKQQYIDPRTQKPKGDPEYSFQALWEKGTDLRPILLTARRVAIAEWGEDGIVGVIYPFKDGDKEADRLLSEAKKKGKNKSESSVAYMRGNIVMKAHSKFDPKVCDNKGNDILPANKGVVYSGSYGRAELNLKAMTVNDTKYVTAYFNFYMKTRDGERLAGRDAKEVFKGLLGGESEADPTDALDDGLAF